jgi:metacaspase-1
MVILMDDTSNPNAYPTRANIIRAMQWLVNHAHPNDSLFFHYSGHGGQSVAFLDNVNGYEDTICPIDFSEAGQINGEVISPQVLS